MITPATVCGVDTTTAMGIAALWNDAIDGMLHTLDQDIANLNVELHHAADGACDRVGYNPRTGTVGYLPRLGIDGCEKCQLLVLCEDTRFRLVDIESGDVEFDLHDVFQRVEDYLNCRRSGRDEVWLHGPVYRLAAELADQIKAQRDANA